MRSRLLHVAIVVSALVFPGNAVAQEAWPDFSAYSAEKAGSPELKRCLGIDPSNVQEGNCLAQEYKRQNRRMEEAFTESLKGASQAEKSQREKAQQAWLAFRSANCKVRSMNPGSGMAVFYYGCLVRETISRRTELTDNWDY
jgi:uncharacterized protein YecT (DUF1311 family)